MFGVRTGAALPTVLRLSPIMGREKFGVILQAREEPMISAMLRSLVIILTPCCCVVKLARYHYPASRKSGAVEIIPRNKETNVMELKGEIQRYLVSSSFSVQWEIWFEAWPPSAATRTQVLRIRVRV